MDPVVELAFALLPARRLAARRGSGRAFPAPRPCGIGRALERGLVRFDDLFSRVPSCLALALVITAAVL